MTVVFPIKWTESVLHFKFICHALSLFKKMKETLLTWCFVLILFQRAWNSL